MAIAIWQICFIATAIRQLDKNGDEAFPVGGLLFRIFVVIEKMANGRHAARRDDDYVYDIGDI